jgi:hypothetical protein
MFIGTTKRKVVSSTILLIIAFLIYVKNIKSGTDQLKIKLKDKDIKKVHSLYYIYYRKVEKVMLMLYFFQELKNY